MDKKELKEWITIAIAFSGLIVLSIGTYYGITQLQDVNINLQNLTSDKVSTKNLQILTPNGTEGGYIYDNGSNLIIGRYPS